MAREASFMIDCSLYSSSIAEIILAFNKIGWSYSENVIEYLPLHDDDMFEWKSENITIEELLSIVTNKQECGELCGVALYHQGSDKGIHLLAGNTKEITVNIIVNRKTICGDFTDISWYIENIVAKLEEIGCLIQSLVYNEHIG